MTALARRTADAALAVLAIACLIGGVGLQMLPITGMQLVVIRGGSMAPAVPIGSLVVARAVPEPALVPGDVVTVRPAAGRAVVTHRITRIIDRDGAVWLELRGDANDAPDPVLVPAAAVLGRVEGVHPEVGRLLRTFGTPSSVLVLAGVAGLLFAAGQILRHGAAGNLDGRVPAKASA